MTAVIVAGGNGEKASAFNDFYGMVSDNFSSPALSDIHTPIQTNKMAKITRLDGMAHSAGQDSKAQPTGPAPSPLATSRPSGESSDVSDQGTDECDDTDNTECATTRKFRASADDGDCGGDLNCAFALNSDSYDYDDEVPALSFAAAGATNYLIWGGGAGVLAGAAAVISSIGGGGSSGASHTSATSSALNYGKVYPTMTAPYDGRLSVSSLKQIRSSNDYIPNSSHYDLINLSYSLARGATGAGVKVAVMDGGVNPNNLDIKNNLKYSDGYSGYHGTAVAGLIAGAMDGRGIVGVAPDADIYSYKISNGSIISDYGMVANKIDQARNAGATVYNNSWNYNAGKASAASIHSVADIANITGHDFIDRISYAATKNDAVFVWAAGNEGNRESGLLSGMHLVMPELDGRFINVVAYDTDAGQLASFSNQCGITKNYCITAPGTDISITYNEERKRTVNGTSFAAPLVSGAVATLRGMYPYLPASEITKLIFVSARDLGTPGIDEVYGYGMLDMERATRPIGQPVVQMANGGAMPLNESRVSHVIGNAIKAEDISMVFTDSFGRAFQTKLNQHLAVLPDPAVGIMRLQKLGTNEPGAEIPGVRMDFRFTSEETNVGLNYGTMRMSMGLRNQPEQLSDGFMNTGDGGRAITVGLENHLRLGGKWSLIQHANFVVQNTDTTGDSIITELTDIFSAGFDAGLRRGNWEFRVAQPMTVRAGKMGLTLPVGQNVETGQIEFVKRKIGLGQTAPTELWLEYGTQGFAAAGMTSTDGEILMMMKYRTKF